MRWSIVSPSACSRAVTPNAVEPWNRYETYLINRMDQAVAFVDEVDLVGRTITVDWQPDY